MFLSNLSLTVSCGMNTGTGTTTGTITGSATGIPTDNSMKMKMKMKYGGSSPVGDFIVIEMDTSNKQLRHINCTTGQTNGWFNYTNLSKSDTDSGGFSILKKIDIGENKTVLFAEFSEVALVYQMFTNTASGMKTLGWPVYCTYSQMVDKTNYYGKKYNWMKFFIDKTSTNSDMNCGFAAFDKGGSANGKFIGAGFSQISSLHNGSNGGVSSINNTGTVTLADLLKLTNINANVIWNNGANNWQGALTMTGTESGMAILDFGPQMGGGGGIAVPQFETVNWAKVSGTYFTMVYSYDLSNQNRQVEPMKLVVNVSNVKVFPFQENTLTGTPVFNQNMQPLYQLMNGPYTNEPIIRTFSNVSKIYQAVDQTDLGSAYQCKGVYIYATNDQVVCLILDESGRFIGFTGFFKTGSSYTIRFGLGIKDADYVNF